MLAVLENKPPNLEVKVFIAARALYASERLNTRDDHILTILVGGLSHILWKILVNGKDYPIYYGK